MVVDRIATAFAGGVYEDDGIYGGDRLIFSPEDVFTVSGIFVQPVAAEEVCFLRIGWFYGCKCR
ncbi:hypothetical protein NOR53_1620 [gamma proteobacterium NOR5-3]|nr:hypothetical protein NOR53_1620 [gamma proteobacterium NOR5-3]